MNRIKRTALLALLLGGATYAHAQFSMDAEIRPRTEYRLGTKDALSTATTEESLSTTQRSRLNLNYTEDLYTLRVSAQDVRTWGAVGTLDKGVSDAFAIHEAWAEINLTDNVAFKAGRQEVIYDDHRIFGNVGWAQQGRSHDLALLKYTGNMTVHLGYANNGDENAAAGYDIMQYLWLNKSFDQFKASGLYLDTDGLITMGGRLSTEVNGVKVNANYYLQDDENTEASLMGFDATYKLNDQVSLGVGYESQSGNSQIEDNGINNAFQPLFGTNHKFNGHMDYFYVGNHKGSVGLNDMFFNMNYKFNDKISAKATYHLFSAAEDMANDLDDDLGNEIDLSLGYNFTKGVSFKLGHSIYNATESMVDLKGGSVGENNNWSWFMLVVKPKFL